jgi:hypothetical protein
MEQGIVIKFYFKSGKTATQVYQDPKNVYSDDWVVHKSPGGSRVFKKAGCRWRMILAQADQFPLGLMNMWRKLPILWCRTGE